MRLTTLALYTRQFSALFSSGVTVVRALTVLTEGPDKAMNQALTDVAAGVARGESLSKSLSRHPVLFSPFYVQLVRLGEATGSLDRVLEKLSAYLEESNRQHERLSSALYYPAMQLIAAVVVLGLLVTFVVPQLEPLLTHLGVPLPWPTRLLVEATRFLTSPLTWLVLAMFYPTWLVIARDVERVDTLRLRQAEVLDRLPVLGRLRQLQSQARTLDALGLLLESGLPFPDALAVLQDATDDPLTRQRLQKARTDLHLGRADTLADLFEANEVFQGAAAQMIRCAEESGQMVGMLRRASALLDLEAGLTLETVMALLEPLIMAFIGLMVGAIVISAYLPLVQVLSGL